MSSQHLLFNGRDLLKKHLLKLSDCNWMVEVNVLVEPLVSQVSPAKLDQRLINRVQVFHSSLT